MLLIRRFTQPLRLVLATFAVSACGARSGLEAGSGARAEDAGTELDAEAEAAPLPCVDAGDCGSTACTPMACVSGSCVALDPVVCDDHDECTKDSCVPETGRCVFEPVTFDLDKDGFRAPLPGVPLGSPAACGNDCDDKSAAAHPGGTETCDGVDNDCNGVVDDGAAYASTPDAPVLVSSSSDRQASRGGLTWDGKKYGVSYAAETSRWKNFFKGLDGAGRTVIPSTVVTSTAGDVFTGPITWTGSLFGTAWEDRRAGDSYDIYFNRFDAQGKKLSADLRVTSQPGFSLHPDLLWNGSEFLVVWDDDSTGDSRIFGRRVSLQGQAVAATRDLTPAEWQAESPDLAAGQISLGLAFTMARDSGKRIGFRRFAANFEKPSGLVVLSDVNSVSPVMVFNGDRYVVAWETRDTTPGKAIWGATVNERGEIRNSARPLTYGSAFARSPSLISLGDRVLLVWAEYESGHYQLYSKILSSELDEILPAKRITSGAGDSLEPTAAFGPNGDVGILFERRAQQGWQVYFQRLLCSVKR